MTGEPDRQSISPSLSGCPGLDSEARWDEPIHLRGELLSRDHLNAHAIDLANAHGAPVILKTPGPLRQRFQLAKKRVFGAYEILGRGAKHRREPSPAEEWLLDNASVVEDQIREIADDLPFGYLLELPRIARGAMRGYPRVYGLCFDYLRHTDGRIDVETLAAFVRAYQSVGRLTIGELWAVPIMLRLGLILRVGALAASEAGERDRENADDWAERLLASAAHPAQMRAVLRELEKAQAGFTASFLVRLLKRLREHDGSLELTREWIAAQCAARETTPDELARREHLRQAADQLSVGNAVTSMRAIAALDWADFFARTSEVELLLRGDPAGAYSQCDESTRNQYRHAVEDMARRSDRDEVAVARAALELCRVQSAASSAAHSPNQSSVAASRQSHVGYFLVDAGRAELEHRIRCRASLRASLVRAVLAHPILFYFATLGALTSLLVATTARVSLEAGLPVLASLALAGLFLLPASEVALALVNALTITLLPPRRLPKLDFSEGIPDEHRTLVVVPALLDSAATIDELIEGLEVRSLGNPDPNLHFALVTDFTDAPAAAIEADEPLLQRARERIIELNSRHLEARRVDATAAHEASSDRPERFWLLHRRRVENPADGFFMGWERKRGKLEELNRLLRGDTNTTFSVVLAPAASFAKVRYVITLDADTELPRDVAAELVGCIAHPLNVPEVDPDRGRVVRGHGVIQPRVGTLPASSRRTRFAALLTGASGIDPYTTAVSDTYQDLFGEGSYVGKGIYHVDAFRAALAGRVPGQRMLSHDLFEGLYARCALASDIEVLDEQPASYAVQGERQHRWMRGDWQLLPWLFPRVPAEQGQRENDVGALGIWKIADNLRRSLLPPLLVTLVVTGWFVHRDVAGAATAILAAALLMPLCARLLLSLVRETARAARPVLGSLGGDLRTNSAQVLLQLVFTLDQAWLSLDAAARALHRTFISKQRLLEWTPTRRAAAGPAHVPRRLWWSGGLCLLGVGVVVWLRPDTWAYAAPLLLAWASAPVLGAWLSLPLPPARPVDRLAETDRRQLRLLAQKTWRFFDEFVTAAENHLPPDNYQEDPRGVIAHRTSPTNIGLYLLSVVSARDFGFITLGNAHERLARSLSTTEKLEKREGHVLNWYDTTTLRPLEPQYVSMVDSGNLAAYLCTLREACADLVRQPLVSAEVVESLRDGLHLAREALREPRSKPKAASDDAPDSRTAPEGNAARQKTARESHERASLEKALRAFEELATGWLEAQASPRALVQGLAVLRADLAESRAQLGPLLEATEAGYWLSLTERRLAEALDEVQVLAPWLAADAPLARMAALPEVAADVNRLRTHIESLGSPFDIVEHHEQVLAQVDDMRERLAGADVSVELSGECRRELETLAQWVQSGAHACEELVDGWGGIAARAAALADAMNFRFLFDERRQLFAIGYNVSSARLDASHYDLLASEARLGSLFSIAKGDIGQSHWFRLGRPRARNPKGPALLSWSGSMFEYLMPLLCTRVLPGTLLSQAFEAAIARQREYAAQQGVPWGISESAYNVMDLRMTYQYRAFGVPGLGLKSGLGESLVVAPYATLLAGLVRPDLIGKNLRVLAAEGLEGPYGMYEAIDYTPEHVPPGRRGVVVKAFMAHHQGMSLVALGNILLDEPMQRRFHRDPRVRATELLLEERVPPRAAPARSPATVLSTAERVKPRADAIEHVGLRSPGSLRVQLLGHGELSSIVSATGTGVTTWKGLDANRFREDPVLEAGGIYLYIKNRSQNRVWSAGYQPTCAEPSFYNVAFSIDRVELHRKDGDVQTVTEVALSPEHALEVRRITLSNQGENPLELELTSYTEVVLAPRGADVGHRAFSNMFVETEALPERFALLARRRPRNAGDAEVWMVQMLVAESHGFSHLDYDCSRERFIGRGRTTAEPAALASDAPLAKRAGLMMDTALALRRGIRLSPGASARLTLMTGLAATRNEALALIDTYSAKHAVTRAIELGWAGVRVELRHLGITSTEVHRFQRLLSAVVFPRAILRQSSRPTLTSARGAEALWALGVSGDLPIVLCRIDHSDYTELCRDVLLAHEFWRLNGFVSDLVFLDEGPDGYLQPIADAIHDLSRHARFDQRGGVFVRRSDQLKEEEREILSRAARVVLRAKEGSLARQLRRVLDSRPVPPLLTPVPGARPRSPEPQLPRPKLTYDNGIGGFSADGREYVMLLEPSIRTPSPWCNVISNPDFGTLVSEVGSSFTWARNSQRYRLTPWNNDTVCDPSGELMYVRDDEDGSFWTPTPEPLGRRARFTVRHGQGYSQFEHEQSGLRQELTLFVSPDEPIKFSRLRVENRGERDRRLSVFAIVDWVLGTSRESSRVAISTSYDTVNDTLFAMNPLGMFSAQRAFLASTRPLASVCGDREEFFGTGGSRQAPEALRRVRLSGAVGAGLDAAGAVHLELEVPAGETVDVTILLGHAESLEQAQALCGKYRREGAVNEALARARKRWSELLGAVRVKTPDRAFDLMQNQWLLYQSLSSRVWGRTGFFQSSGAYGYRDQLQDVLASVQADPTIARGHILRSAARQFVEGDVQHWWHDETGHGLRSRCSDDMLWLPFATAEYVRMTGDVAILDERVPFLVERQLASGEEDLFSAPPVSSESASLYEHCCRAIRAGTTAGAHGLPLMKSGDWNDGMNRVGHEGRGESVWLAWFLAKTLTEFAQLARLKGDGEREAAYTAEAKRVARAADEHGWDGEWYRRASFDDGTWVGSRANAECSIDAIAQSWAVIAGVGDPERAASAVAASEARLIVPSLRMMKLLTPAFEQTRPDPGYIQSYPAGIRENGGQYTHGVLWTVLALTLLGAGDRAGELLSLLNPVRHGDTPDGVERYRVEPYVVAADVYGGSGYEGRGGWTWYTGSAGWMYRIGMEHVIGLRRRGRTLAITPCIPSSWASFEVDYRYGTTTYHILVENPERVCQGVIRLEIDGQRAQDGYVRLESDGRQHEVRVTLGRVLPSRAPRASGSAGASQA